jgi:predicted acylesterase/phospholipase RssA
MKNIKHLVLSGGGMLGISYIGLIKYLEEQNKYGNFKSITGCSAGSLFATLIAIGYTSNELITIVKTMKYKEYININAESIINFMKLKGLESGKNLITFIKKYIKDKIGNEDITFKEIKEKFNIELQIGVTNLTHYKFQIMNSINTPDIPVHKAISASIAVPFVFEPVVIGNDLFCDGGLLNNLPIESLIMCDAKGDAKDDAKDDANGDSKDDAKDSQDQCSILAIYLLTNTTLVSKDNYQSISLTQYMNTIMHTLSYEFINSKIQINNMVNQKCKIIIYDIPCDIMTFIKLNSSHEDIDNIIDIAYNTTTKHFLEN